MSEIQPINLHANHFQEVHQDIVGPLTPSKILICQISTRIKQLPIKNSDGLNTYKNATAKSKSGRTIKWKK